MDSVARGIGLRIITAAAKTSSEVQAGARVEFTIPLTPPAGMVPVALTRIMPMTINLNTYCWAVGSSEATVLCRAMGTVSSGTSLLVSCLCARREMMP